MNRLGRMSSSKKLLTAIIFLWSFTLHTSTGYPTVAPGGNHGELTLTAYSLSISHPTGYPAFHSLLKIFQFLPFGAFDVKMNVSSALVTAINAALLFLILLQSVNTLSAAFGAAIFTIVPQIWSQALSLEVYPLAVLFFLLQIRILFSLNGGTRQFLLLCFFFGLGLSHHMLNIILLPSALLFLSVSPTRKNFRKLPQLFLTGLFFVILALSSYIYLPLRSVQNPLMDWGNPEHLSSFIRHVFGVQFRDQMLHMPISELLFRFVKKVISLNAEFPPVLWLFALAGFFSRTLRNSEKLFLASFMMLSLTVIFFYNIFDIHEYFFPLIIGCIILVAHGSFLVQRKLKKKLAALIMLFVFCFLFIKGYCFQEASGRFMARDYGNIIIKSVPENSILFIKGDNPAGSLSVVNALEKRNRTLTIYDENCNLFRNAYGIHPQEKNFLREKIRFERRLIFFGKHPVFYTQDQGKNYLVLPLRSCGLVYTIPRFLQYCRELDFSAMDSQLRGADVPITILPMTDREMMAEYCIHWGDAANEAGCRRYARRLYDEAGRWGWGMDHILALAGSRLFNVGQQEAAIELYKKALSLNPFNPGYYNNLAWYLFLTDHNDSQMLNLIDKAIEMEPQNWRYLSTQAWIYWKRGAAKDEYLPKFRKAYELSGRDESAGLNLQAAENDSLSERALEIKQPVSKNVKSIPK